MEERKHPVHAVNDIAFFYGYPFKDLIPSDPEYIPETKFFKSDNRIPESYNNADTPVFDRFRGTAPAKGFELPRDENRHKIYKYTKLGENGINIQWQFVYKDPVITEVKHPVYGYVVSGSYSRVVEVYALITTNGYNDFNKSHRGVVFSGAIPVTIVEQELRNDAESGYYTFTEVRHYWRHFAIALNAKHDTSPAYFSAPSPPEKKLIGSYTETNSFSNSPSYNSFNESWAIQSYIYGWALYDGGYPKFKE